MFINILSFFKLPFQDCSWNSKFRGLGVAVLIGIALCPAIYCAEDQQKNPATVTKEAVPAFDGSLLVTPWSANETVLVNADKSEAHVWSSRYRAAAAARLLPDGSILRIAMGTTAGSYARTPFNGGRIQRIAWDGTMLWDFWSAATYHMVCGDAIQLPNGNVLMGVVEYRSKNDVLALGRDPNKISNQGLFAPGLMEFQPLGKKGGRLVWRWSLWDHLSQNADPAKPGFEPAEARSMRPNIDATLPGVGFAFSEIAYDPESDLVVMPVWQLGELWVLDHSTTLAQAKTTEGGKRGLGGSLMRWKPSEQVLGNAKARIVSLEFSSDGAKSGAVAELRAFAQFAPEGKVLDAGISRITLERAGTPGTSGLNFGGALERNWETPLADSLDYPSSYAAGSEGNTFVVNRIKGDVHMIDANGRTEWGYINERGMNQFYIVRSKPNEQCCLPASLLGKADKEQIPVRAASIAGAHYYSSAFLNAKIIVPKGTGENPH